MCIYSNWSCIRVPFAHVKTVIMFLTLLFVCHWYLQDRLRYYRIKREAREAVEDLVRVCEKHSDGDSDY